MSPPWTTRAVTFLTALTLGCASATATAGPAKTPVPKDPKAPTLSSPTTTSPDVKKARPAALVPVTADPTTTAGSGSDRVALIWGYPSCSSRPWIVSVVDLGARLVTTRALSSGSELELYMPSPMGGACYKGACATMSVVMPPQPPTLFSGTGTMTGGGGKGLRYSASTDGTCPEPPMVTDADLFDWAARMVAARNDAQAAIAAARAAGR